MLVAHIPLTELDRLESEIGLLRAENEQLRRENARWRWLASEVARKLRTHHAQGWKFIKVGTFTELLEELER